MSRLEPETVSGPSSESLRERQIRIDEVRSILFLLALDRLGPPPAPHQAFVNAIKDYEHLLHLCRRVGAVKTWDRLITPGDTPLVIYSNHPFPYTTEILEDSSTTRIELEILAAPLLRDVILKLGTRRFGPPSKDVRFRIECLKDAFRLRTIAGNLFDAGSWDEWVPAEPTA